MEATIPCPRCKQEKPASAFYFRHDRQMPRPMYPCKTCRSEAGKAERRLRRPRPAPGFKHCARCDRDMPVSEFGENRSRPDGRQAYCRACFLDYRAVSHVPVTKTAPPKKRCEKCRVVKPIDDFRDDGRRQDGRARWCRPCHDEWLGARWGRRPEIPEGMKRCSRCREVKPVEEFFRNAARHDGLTSYCKVCFPEHAAYKRGQKSPRFKDNKARYLRERRKTDPEFARKGIVRRFTNDAIALGILVRLPCAACGDPKTVAHHTDYTKPLEVQWLCKAHHQALGHTGDFANPPVPVPVLAMMA